MRLQAAIVRPLDIVDRGDALRSAGSLQYNAFRPSACHAWGCAVHNNSSALPAATAAPAAATAAAATAAPPGGPANKSVLLAGVRATPGCHCCRRVAEREAGGGAVPHRRHAACGAAHRERAERAAADAGRERPVAGGGPDHLRWDRLLAWQCCFRAEGWGPERSAGAGKRSVKGCSTWSGPPTQRSGPQSWCRACGVMCLGQRRGRQQMACLVVVQGPPWRWLAGCEKRCLTHSLGLGDGLRSHAERNCTLDGLCCALLSWEWTSPGRAPARTAAPRPRASIPSPPSAPFSTLCLALPLLALTHLAPPVVCADFGFGQARRRAEQFIRIFEDIYCLRRARVRGEEVRLFKCYPGAWQVRRRFRGSLAMLGFPRLMGPRGNHPCPCMHAGITARPLVLPALCHAQGLGGPQPGWLDGRPPTRAPASHQGSQPAHLLGQRIY
jgi:hypothetical protein